MRRGLLARTQSSQQTVHQFPVHVSPQHTLDRAAGQRQMKPQVATVSGSRPPLLRPEAPATEILAWCVRSSLPPNRMCKPEESISTGRGRLEEGAALKVFEGLAELLLGVHDDGAVPRDRLLEGL